MSSAPTARLLARSFFQNAVRPATVARTSPVLLRSFAQTATPRAEETDTKKNGQALLNAMYGSSKTPSAPGQRRSALESAGLSKDSMLQELDIASGGTSDLSGLGGLDGLMPDREDLLEPYHIHIMSHKHNTHVTVTKPDRGAIISLSTGNIGFKKSKRKSYDAAYQLMAYVLEKLQYQGWHKKITDIEVVLRGFGQGRDAAVKVLMAPEGKIWRQKVVRVADSTRLKFGGTRSKNPRRV